ncbi:creatininase family protein [Lacibacterium aquatile]|uniref:Creatininase family protein n=1 Tax=Lacibacterium aquatile TaxID=1168082 RepID=A0ABW5DKX3_9PROT
MRVSEANWFQVEEYLKHDDRAVLPLGSTEQHAYLSLAVDSILSEKVSVDAAAPLGVPVFPAIPFGITPYFMAYPGSISLKAATYMQVVRDVLDSLYTTGFRKILIVNGHGGNSPVQPVTMEFMTDRPGTRVKFHNWWNSPKTWAKVKEIDPVASHASWMENFPWTRIEGVEQPTQRKPYVPFDKLKDRGPEAVREIIGDGNYGGLYERSDEDMNALWSVAVAETRGLLEDWS